VSGVAAVADRHPIAGPDGPGPARLTAAVDAAGHRLDRLAPDLAGQFRAAVPRAADTVGRRLLGALCRERLGSAYRGWAGRGTRHAFDRVEFAAGAAADPLRVLAEHLTGGRAEMLAEELTDAVVNLALGYARAAGTARRLRAAGAADVLAALAGTGADETAVRLEQLATDGHNLHPCGRTRLGWQIPDLLAHDLEAGRTGVGFLAVRRDLHLGDDVAGLLRRAYPQVPDAPAGYVCQPVHLWQRERVLTGGRHADLVAGGALRPLPGAVPAALTATLRTLLLPTGTDDRHRYLKLSLDIQVTSTRRTMSVASTRNGPAISRLLHRLLAADPAGERVLLLAEVAGAAVPAPGRDRDLAAILRDGLDRRLAGAEIAVPGGALPAADPLTGRTVLATLVDRFRRTRGLADSAAAALAFVDEYARLLLPPVLRLLTRYGVGLEAHLQNCLPTFLDGVPHRLVLRDFGGLRLHRERLAAAGVDLPLWPGSVIGTGSTTVLRAKVGYTSLQAHLGEIVLQLAGSHGLVEAAAWRRVRAVVDEVYDGLRADPATTRVAAADHAALVAARVPHKALLRMRLAGSGDVYLAVRNALHDAGRCAGS
jgi:siderophore synthetase component